MASVLNPKPSDYEGQFRLGGICAVIGILLLVFGLDESDDWLNSIMVIIGVSLVIGGGAVILTAYRSKVRADKAEDG